MNNKYVHGYSKVEGKRLRDQSLTLAELLHHDTVYPAGSTVLEASRGNHHQEDGDEKRRSRMVFVRHSDDLPRRSRNHFACADSPEYLNERTNRISIQSYMARISPLPHHPAHRWHGKSSQRPWGESSGDIGRIRNFRKKPSQNWLIYIRCTSGTLSATSAVPPSMS